MGTYALTLSPTSKPFLLSQKQPLQISTIFRLSAINNLKCGLSWSPTSISISRTRVCNELASKRLLNFKVRSASSPESTNEVTGTDDISVQTLQLGSMFAVWYFLNIYFNILNKQVLKVYPFPTTVTAFQFGCGTVLVLLMWALNLHKKPKINRSQFTPIFLLALGHTVGNLLTNISLGKVSVSFTHTIKAMEPFFTVLLSALLFRERPSLWVVSSLVPIVGGVALASFSEVSFNWIGFSSAMASNLTNQTRNVFSKKLLVRKEETLDDINLFSIITIISSNTCCNFLGRCQLYSFVLALCFEPRFEFERFMYKSPFIWCLLPFLPTGFLYDITNGIACDTCCRKQCQKSGCSRIISNCLPYARLIDEFLRNCFGSCWSFLIFKSKENQAESCSTFLMIPNIAELLRLNIVK